MGLRKACHELFDAYDNKQITYVELKRMTLELEDKQESLFAVKIVSDKTAVMKVLNNTNWPLLGKQKIWLLDYTGQMPDGLISFLDALQDAVVEDEIAKEGEVFPNGDEL